MNICKPLFTIIVASALSGLAPQVIAKNNSGYFEDDADIVAFVRPPQVIAKNGHGQNKCSPKITSTSITIENEKPAWYVSGDCLEKVTKVSLAKDDGAGFEDLGFTVTMAPGNPDAKTSLVIPLVSRMAGVGGINIGGHEVNIGQYLLQVKSCQTVKIFGEKCKVYDEAYMPALGDHTIIGLLMELMEKLKVLFPR
jgi:hypothetical protein